MSQCPAVLFVCGSRNQTTQLHAVARAMPHARARFSPFYGTRFVQALRRLGLIENTIGGERSRARCLAYLRDHGLEVDLDGTSGDYDLIVSCTDLVLPHNRRGRPLVVVQEGMTDPDSWISDVIWRSRVLPLWLASTALTGLSGAYDRFCVASEGYREFFASRGALRDRLRVTGIPNFDDCASLRPAAIGLTGYVLACTSDLRETYRRDDRAGFIAKVARIAAGRPICFKLHPNEREARAREEIARQLPNAKVFLEGSAEELVAGCSVLVTQLSSVTFVGLALGKEVHSDLDVERLRRLVPVQNGGRSAGNIAEVCGELLRTGPLHEQRALAQGAWA